MKEKQNCGKIKCFVKKGWNNFTDWFTDKEHPRSRLNKVAFFQDSFKLISLILVFLIVHSNVDKINQIVLIFVKLGSLLQLVLLFFILRKVWHLAVNLKYAFRGLNNGAKTIVAIIIVLLLFVAFLNQDKMVDPIIQTYQEVNFSKFNPFQISGGFNLGNSMNTIKCQADFDEDLRKFKIKHPRTSVKIIEKKSTDNLSEALEFVKGWNANNEQGTLNYLRENFKQNPEGLKYADQESIDLILYRVDGESCIIDYCVPYSELRFAVCRGDKAVYPQETLGDALNGILG